MKNIIVFEGIEYINFGTSEDELTINEIKELNKVIKNKNLKSSYIHWKYNKLKFMNYVGLITLSNATIEILSKIKGESKKESRKALLNMLVTSKFINVKYSELSKINFEYENILEILAYLFSIKLKFELKRGLYKEYIHKNEDLCLIKGKINFNRQMKNISRSKIKISFDYDEFSENNILNQLFSSMVFFLNNRIKSLKTKENFQIIKSKFIDVGLIPLENIFIDKVKFNRNNFRFKESFILLKKILNSQLSLGEKGKNEGFSLLFEVNDLYEKYIGTMIKKIEPSANIQDTSKKLMINKKTKNSVIQLKPDIVIPNKLIIDTKWKILYKDVNRYGVKTSDLYQMYAYLNRYKDISKVILLYPLINFNDSNEEILESFILHENEDRAIDIAYIDISSSKSTLEGLKALLGYANIKAITI